MAWPVVIPNHPRWGRESLLGRRGSFQGSKAWQRELCGRPVRARESSGGVWQQEPSGVAAMSNNVFFSSTLCH